MQCKNEVMRARLWERITKLFGHEYQPSACCLFVHEIVSTIISSLGQARFIHHVKRFVRIAASSRWRQFKARRRERGTADTEPSPPPMNLASLKMMSISKQRSPLILILRLSSLARGPRKAAAEKFSVSGWLALFVAIVPGPIGLYYAYKAQQLAYQSTMITKWTAKKTSLLHVNPRRYVFSSSPPSQDPCHEVIDLTRVSTWPRSLGVIARCEIHSLRLSLMSLE